MAYLKKIDTVKMEPGGIIVKLLSLKTTLANSTCLLYASGVPMILVKLRLENLLERQRTNNCSYNANIHGMNRTTIQFLSSKYSKKQHQ